MGTLRISLSLRLFARDHHAGGIEALLNFPVVLHFEVVSADRLRYRRLDLPAPERGSQSPGYFIDDVESGYVLTDEHQRESSIRAQYPVDLAQGAEDVLRTHQLQKVTADHGVERYARR